MGVVSQGALCWFSSMSSTTSASAPSSTPSSPAFHFPTILPRKEQPNAHPYAIQTSSTAILSRSNSTSNHASVGPHHYIPMSPSPTSPNNSPTKMHRPTRHRYSRSLTSDQPPPLPRPPGAVDEDNTPTKNGHRAENLPSTGSLLQDLDLPDDPKSWMPSQLSTYLSATLSTGDTNLPTPVAKDIAKFINERGITGKTFLRFSEDDLLQCVFFFHSSTLRHSNPLMPIQQVRNQSTLAFDSSFCISRITTDNSARSDLGVWLYTPKRRRRSW